MSPVYLVTLTLDLTGVRAAEAATRLLAEDAVVTVRIDDAGAPSVVRVDIEAGTENQATGAACELMTAVGRRLGGALAVRSARGVLDAERREIAGDDHDHM
jgi:hypothetical protein